MARPVGGLRKHPHGRVDQLEDRYLGMVEAPSSNLGTSTPVPKINIIGVDCAAKTNSPLLISVIGSARPPLYRIEVPYWHPVKWPLISGVLPAKSLIKNQGVLQSWQGKTGMGVPTRHRTCPRCVPYLRSPNSVNASNSKHPACTSRARCFPFRHCSTRPGSGSMQVRARCRFEHRPLGNLLTRVMAY